MVRYIACVAHSDDRRALIGVAGGSANVRFCATIKDLVSFALANETGKIVFELRPVAAGDVVAAAKALLEAGRPLPFLVRLELNPTTAKGLVELAKVSTDLIVSLRDRDRLELDLELLDNPVGDHAVGPAIVAHLGKDMRRAELVVVAAAAMTRGRRVRVAALARVCKCPIRTLESRLQRAHLMRPSRLLAWTAGLHAVWRIDTLGWSVKRAASRAGFGTSQSFSNHLRRHLGAAPLRLVADGGSSGLLDHFVAVLAAQLE